MNKRKYLFILIVLILVLGVVDAAWIVFYKKTITTNVIGEEKTFTIFQEFNSILSLNTSNGPAETKTLMEIKDLTEDANMTFEIETRRTNLTSETECPNFEDDCGVIITHIYPNGMVNITNILSNKPTTIGDEANFILLKNINHFIEYKIQCVEDSCPQRVSSNITLEQV